MDIYLLFFGETYYGAISTRTGKSITKFNRMYLNHFIRDWESSRVYLVHVPY